MKSRDLFEPRLRPGIRVRYDYGKWDCCANAVRFVPDWAAQSWAYTRLGTTTEKDEFSGSVFPETHPWGLPDFATPVRFDDDPDRVNWIRTSCLDVIDSIQVLESGQQVLLFS